MSYPCFRHKRRFCSVGPPNFPVVVRMNDLEHQPRSDDPEFWKVWTGAAKRKIDWRAVADEWQARGKEGESEEEFTTTDDAKNSTCEAEWDGDDEEDIPSNTG